MNQPYYPPIDLATIRMFPILKRQADEQGVMAFLERSPYSPEVFPILKDLLGASTKPSTGGSPIEIDEASVEAMTGDQVERELAVLYRKMKTYGSTLTSEQSSEQAAYFRVATSLMTKLVDLMERSANVSQVVAFKQRTLKLLSDVMTPDQRNEFLEGLKLEFGLQTDPE